MREMATILQCLMLLMAILGCATSTPLSHNHHEVHPSAYVLSANCPDLPWHGRGLIILRISQQLGLENFTIHPRTPAPQFRPIRLDKGNYALRFEGNCKDPDKVPYLAALESSDGTRTASMAVVCSFSPNEGDPGNDTNVCPKGYTCTMDQWTYDPPGSDRVYRNFKFAGFEGHWMPFKDAGKEGWHVYWKGNADSSHQIGLDLLPTKH